MVYDTWVINVGAHLTVVFFPGEGPSKFFRQLELILYKNHQTSLLHWREILCHLDYLQGVQMDTDSGSVKSLQVEEVSLRLLKG